MNLFLVKINKNLNSGNPSLTKESKMQQMELGIVEQLATIDINTAKLTRKQIREVGTKINNTEARFLVDRKYKNGY